MTSREVIQKIEKVARYLGKSGAIDIEDELMKSIQIIEKDLEVLELLHKRIKSDIFGRICYVPIVEERDGVVQDFEAEKIWGWLKNDKRRNIKNN